MNRIVLFTLIFGILSGAAVAQDSLFTKADAAKYADAARLVLIRGLSESIAGLKESLTVADTVYVAYPDHADPPPAFLQNMPVKNLVCLPYSQNPGHYWNDAARLSTYRSISPDSVNLEMSWALYAIRKPDTTEVVAPMSPWGRAAQVTVVRIGHKWQITKWTYLPLE
jgi:hypothetical protein